jgi:NAD(P)-dependent dehydrogenase (short-subunit alcohol dehydrogenase family)
VDKNTQTKRMIMKRTALITGGSRGIGFGVAISLARSGFDICICGTRPEKEVAGAVRKLKSIHRKVLYVQADISRREDRKQLVDAVRREFKQLNVLVNNAGIAPRQRNDILDATEESFDEVISINLRGPYFLTQQVVRWMIEQKKAHRNFNGCIINVSSISSTVASLNRGEYCISKAGISMATRLWAVRLAEFGIMVYEVRPGIISTDMTAGVQAKYDKLISEGLLLQPRWGTPDDVGKAVTMLAQGCLPYSTGQVVMVDGGFSVERL